jgi:hypothetical protein
MARRSFFSNNWTTGTGTADNAQVTSGQYMSLDPGSASQMIQVKEVSINGLAGASAVQNMQFRRTVTAGTGGASALVAPNCDGPLNTFAAAVTTVPIAAVAYVTNQPIPGNTVTQAKLCFAINAFGGIERWRAGPDDEWWMVGTAANQASTLSNNTGSTSSTVSSHIIYELY